MNNEELIEKCRLTDNVLGSPLWRPLHDILIDWNEGRIKLEEQGLPDLVNKMAKGENNIKAVKQMVKILLLNLGWWARGGVL